MRDIKYKGQSELRDITYGANKKTQSKNKKSVSVKHRKTGLIKTQLGLVLNLIG